MATAKKLPSGSWRARAFAGYNEKGKPVYKSFTAPTKKEAEFLAAEFAAGRKKGAPAEDSRTLAEAYAEYIELKRNTLSPTTVREYSKASKRDFPSLMQLKLSQITQQNVQGAVNIMAATHSPKSVRNAHGLLSAVLALFAPEIRLNTRLPQKKKADLYIPVEAEIEQLIHNIRGTELEKAVLLAAFGSLRRSECCALTEEDISGNVVSVTKALVLDENNEWVLKQPKSEAGYREVLLPHFVIERLKPVRDKHKIVALAPSTVSDSFSEALAKVGLPHFRFHDLRHYQASILHAMGVPDKYIMERGGWRTDSTLKNIYQHTMSDKRKEVEHDICARFEEAHQKYEEQQNPPGV